MGGQRAPVYARLRSYIDDVAELSHKTIALNAGMSEARLSLLLSGKRRMSIDDYETLCRAIAVNPARFLSP